MANIDNVSILNTVKNGLNIPLEVTAYDPELVININSVLASIIHMGIGLEEGFEISGSSETWADFLGENDKRKYLIKTLVIEKVRKTFDPAANATVAKARDEIIHEYEFRLFVMKEDEPYLNKTSNK